MTRFRAQIMEHEGISTDHFADESMDANREWLLRYFKARQKQAVETGKFKASIRNFSAWDLETLIEALSAEEPQTYIGGVEREMRKDDD